MSIESDCRTHPVLPVLLLRGASGLEVKLSDRPVSRSDVENPVPECTGSHRASSESEHSDEEQGFVSSVVTSRQHQQQEKRVHWGDLPRRDGEDQTHNGVKHERGTLSDDTKLSQPISDSGSLEETRELLQQVGLSDTPASALQTSHNISQVGMSRKTAAGLRNLLKSHGKAPALTLGLLEALTRTLTEWRTHETMR